LIVVVVVVILVDDVVSVVAPEDVVVVSEVKGSEFNIKVLISSLSLPSQIRSETESAQDETMLGVVSIV
jgi:hypothetical protein